MSLGFWLSLATLAAGQSPADRRRPPEPGPPRSLRLPAIERRSLANGLDVLLVRTDEVPVVVVHVMIASGAAADPIDKAGLATLTADLLNEGAGARTALEIADELDYLGAELALRADWDQTSVRLHIPVERLEPALDVFADILLRPTFPDEELERARKRHLTALVQDRDRPHVLAAAAYYRALYGADHRYGVGIDGTIETFRRLGRDDVVAFYRRHFVPANATAIVVGDIEADRALGLLEERLGGWPSGPVPEHGLPRPSQVAARRVVLVDKPRAAQSELRVVRLGVARTTPDYDAIEVMNTILGGSFTSRLNMNLREEHGYTYGAGSAFVMRRDPGPFVAASAVETGVTVEAIVEILRELDRIREPVPADELERAKRYLALGFPARFETTRQIAANLAELALYRLPWDFFDRYVERILAVGADEVRRVARAYIDPDAVLVVVVGDRARIEEPLRRAGLGPVETLSVDELLGSAEGLGAPAP